MIYIQLISSIFTQLSIFSAHKNEAFYIQTCIAWLRIQTYIQQHQNVLICRIQGKEKHKSSNNYFVNTVSTV